MLRIGIDFGGVIVPSQTDSDSNDNPFFDWASDRFLTVQECKGATSVLQQMLKQGYQLHLVSKAKAKAKMRRRTLQWLSKHRFIGTIFEQSRIHFCEKRAEKRDICKNLGISLLIDDSIDVLNACQGQVKYLVLFGASVSQDFVPCRDWNMVQKYIESLNLEEGG